MGDSHDMPVLVCDIITDATLHKVCGIKTYAGYDCYKQGGQSS